MRHHQIDKLDEKILKLISGNARIPFLEVARECNVSGAAIHQRIQKLQNIGVIKGSEFILDANRIGYNTCAYMGIFLKDANLFKDVVDELHKIPEVVECHYTTGQYAMFIKIYAKNNKDFLRIIHEKLQPIRGISSTETIISLSEGFRRQLPIIGIAEENEEE
jgi:Lrp/AsnC family transcriptional regulator for asnA, asnC and gidA